MTRPVLPTICTLLAVVACSGTVNAGLRDKDEDTWTIRCLTLTGPNRFKLADEYAAALKKVPKLKSKLVQVFHEQGESSVYYGRYKRVYNKKTGKESYRPDHLRDLNRIRELSLDVRDKQTGTVRTYWPFHLATMTTLPIGRSKHPEWMLNNAPGYYSLQVAVFYNTETMRRRRYAAEEYCRLLRKEGQEAYFHHGEINSSVCIGSFPKEAIQTFQEKDPYTGMIRARSRIVDQRMLDLQKKYPRNLQNGSVFYEITRDPKTGKKIRTPHASFAVIVPHENRKAVP